MSLISILTTFQKTTTVYDALLEQEFYIIKYYYIRKLYERIFNSEKLTKAKLCNLYYDHNLVTH